MLAWTIYLSFIGAVAVTLMPGNSPPFARVTALLTTLAGLGIAIAAVGSRSIGATDHHRENAVDIHGWASNIIWPPMASAWPWSC